MYVADVFFLLNWYVPTGYIYHSKQLAQNWIYI
jgi:hypothetical protein